MNTDTGAHDPDARADDPEADTPADPHQHADPEADAEADDRAPAALEHADHAGWRDRLSAASPFG